MSRAASPLLGLILVAALGCDGLSARHRASQAAEFYKKGDYQNALYKYEQAAQLDPAIDTVQLNLALTYLQLYRASPKSHVGKEYGGLAVRAFQEYLKRRPGEAAARDHLIATFVDTQRYDDAVAYFKPEVEAAKPNLEAIFTLGQIAAKTGRFAQALEWYQKRIDLAPNDPDGPYNLGVLIWDHLHNHTEVVGPARVTMADRGLAALRKAIELRPQDANGYTYLNLTLRERATGQPDDVTRAADIAEAEKFMRQALELLKAAKK